VNAMDVLSHALVYHTQYMLDQNYRYWRVCKYRAGSCSQYVHIGCDWTTLLVIVGRHYLPHSSLSRQLRPCQENRRRNLVTEYDPGSGVDQGENMWWCNLLLRDLYKSYSSYCLPPTFDIFWMVLTCKILHAHIPWQAYYWTDRCKHVHFDQSSKM
jgi:hypothetical protein